jgi:O-antigen/teichoic acid export membrane protein
MKKGSMGGHTVKLWVTSAVAALASYLFYFFMARMLTQAEYGILYSLIALLYIFSVPTETIRFVISRYITIFKTKREYGKMINLFKRSFKKIFLYSLPCLLFVLIITPIWLSNFLHVEIWYIFLASLTIPLIFLLPIIHGMLQGLNRFVALGINNSIEMIVKLVIGIVLVLFGLKIYGAIVAIPLSVLLAIGFGFIPLKNILKGKKGKEEKIETKSIYGYFFPFLLVILFLTMMSSVDVLIAKHFFSPIYAGFYAAISTLGTILFFLSIGVTKVMFPLVSEKYHLKKEKEHKDLLYKSLFLVVLPFSLWVLLLILFPKFIVGVLLGAKYLAIANFVKYEAIAMGFLGLSNVLVLYNLAINRKKFLFLPAVFCILEIVLLSFFHGSLTQYLRMLILVNLLLFLSLLFVSIKPSELYHKIKGYIKFKNYKNYGVDKLKWLRKKKKRQKSKKKEKNQKQKQINQLKKY